MIIKEMFAPPAALYLDPVVGDPPPKDPKTGASPLDGLITSWTVMVKDRSVARGGWFYANPDAPKIDTAAKTPGQIKKEIEAAIEKALDNYDYPFPFPTSGIALGTCQRCHASAVSEMTFSSLDNILGFPGQPIRFRNDNTWRNPAPLRAAQEGPNLFAAAAPAGTPTARPDSPRHPPWAVDAGPDRRGRQPGAAAVRDVGTTPAADAAANEDRRRAGGSPRPGPTPRSSPPSPWPRRRTIPRSSPASGPTVSSPGRTGPRRTSPPTTAWAATAASEAPLRPDHVRPDRDRVRRRLQPLRVRRVAVVADGPGRSRSDLPRADRERAGPPRRRVPPRQGRDRQDRPDQRLHELPRRMGQRQLELDAQAGHAVARRQAARPQLQARLLRPDHRPRPGASSRSITNTTSTATSPARA